MSQTRKWTRNSKLVFKKKTVFLTIVVFSLHEKCECTEISTILVDKSQSFSGCNRYNALCKSHIYSRNQLLLNNFDCVACVWFCFWFLLLLKYICIYGMPFFHGIRPAFKNSCAMILILSLTFEWKQNKNRNRIKLQQNKWDMFLSVCLCVQFTVLFSLSCRKKWKCLGVCLFMCLGVFNHWENDIRIPLSLLTIFFVRFNCNSHNFSFDEHFFVCLNVDIYLLRFYAHVSFSLYNFF